MSPAGTSRAWPGGWTPIATQARGVAGYKTGAIEAYRLLPASARVAAASRSLLSDHMRPAALGVRLPACQFAVPIYLCICPASLSLASAWARLAGVRVHALPYVTLATVALRTGTHWHWCGDVRPLLSPFHPLPLRRTGPAPQHPMLPVPVRARRAPTASSITQKSERPQGRNGHNSTEQNVGPSSPQEPRGDPTRTLCSVTIDHRRCMFVHRTLAPSFCLPIPRAFRLHWIPRPASVHIYLPGRQRPGRYIAVYIALYIALYIAFCRVTVRVPPTCLTDP
ncbi:hypothetical protein GGX14DRAFT_571933 [Mycena pura]|uniref:Uncharacterized protein n=1 Tax=Mycena pura TaxID=153505 RepID=A0AAD6V265_9AGAR|nr:hypothetical protein GGX14DRAFT_571933 [Mycena pura]